MFGCFATRVLLVDGFNGCKGIHVERCESVGRVKVVTLQLEIVDASIKCISTSMYMHISVFLRCR